MQNDLLSASLTTRMCRAVATIALVVGAVLSSVTPAAAQLFRIGTNPVLLSVGMRGTDSAYDPINQVYLVVGAYGPVWGAFSNTSGSAVSTFQINSSGGFAHFPRVVYSPHVSNGVGGFGGFLVTWIEGAGGDNFVNTRIVAYPNRLVTPQRVISSPATWWESGAAVAYSPSSRTFLTTFRTTDYRIWGGRLNTNGEVVGSFQISPNSSSRDPNVAWNSSTNEFGVVYTGWGANGATTGITILGAAGNIIRHNIFNFGGATYISDIAFNSATGRYLAVWSQGGTLGAEIAANGDVVATGLISSTTGTYDGLGLAYNSTSGTFLLVGHGPSADVWGAELNSRGARTSSDTAVTSAGGLGAFYPRASARSGAAHWNVSFAQNFASVSDQIVGTSSTGGGPAGSLGSGTAPSGGGGSTGGCPGTAPFPGAVCVNGGWVAGSGDTGGSSGGSTGGCPGTAPFPGAVCVNGGWVPGSGGSGGSGTSTGGCPGTAPFPGAVCVNGGWVPGSGGTGGSGTSTGGCPGTAPFPGAVCVNGGWVPGSGGSTGGSTSGCPGTAPFPGAVCVNGGWVPGSGGSTGGSTGGCPGTAPFPGAVCVNGGWVPGTGGSGGSGTSTGGCTTPDPFLSLGGGTCVNGGWLPPSGSSGSGSTCTTPSPGSGWTCVNGGWLPPEMSPGGSSSGGCTTPDPFTAMGGGVCVNGGWIPRNSGGLP